MAVTSIQRTLFNPPDSDVSGRTPTKTLGQDDFLKLLVTQLTSQDPLSPTGDTEFIAQMASFSTLEQSKAMQTDMTRMRAESLLGRSVEITQENIPNFRGVVMAIDVKEGMPKVVVNGRGYDLNQVLTVTEAPPLIPV
jgi:flagellar basal-body rod modification protein FlgD